MEFQFRTVQELLLLTEKHHISVGEVIIRSEMELQNTTREQLLERMKDYYVRMKNSVYRGLEITARSRSGLSGGDSKSLFVAAGIGKIIGYGACFSGAQGGCQAEVGSACCMGCCCHL